MSRNDTFRSWFDEFNKNTGETPIDIVFGWDTGWGDGDDMAAAWPEVVPNQVVAFADLPDSFLDRPFDSSYGGPETPDMCGWSPNFVVFSDQYDGSEHICWVPRNPIAHQPTRPGG